MDEQLRSLSYRGHERDVLTAAVSEGRCGARVWFYMREAHGVEILPEEEAMFARWSAADPVSRWESERERRIARYSRVSNPFVDGVEPDEAGACVWE